MIRRLSRAVAEGAVTPRQLHEAALAGGRDSELNAFCSLAGPQPVARDAAGRLRGMPVAVKDNFCTEGLATTCGSRTLESFVPGYSATAVRRLLAAGCVLLGKTNLDPFGMGSGAVDGARGPVRNPWTSRSDLAGGGGGGDFYVAGGSSGGSAAAVAAGLAVGALASDTGGSARIPAAYCGVVAIKPTYGLVSRHGLVPLVNALDCVSVMANSVADACDLLAAVQGPDGLDSTCLPSSPPPLSADAASIRGLRVGVPTEFHTPGVSASMLESWRRVVDFLSASGLRCQPVSLPHTQLSIKCYSVLCCAEVASNMARYDGVEFGLRLPPRPDAVASTESLYSANRRAGFNEVIRSRVLAGNYFLLRRNYQRYYLQARRVWRLIKEDFDRAFADVDLLVCPAALSAAWRHSEFVRSDSRTRSSALDLCTQSVNLAGAPALVLPVAVDQVSGMPIGIQLVGPRLSESRLASVGAAIESWAAFPSLASDTSPLLRLLDGCQGRC